MPLYALKPAQLAQMFLRHLCVKLQADVGMQVFSKCLQMICNWSSDAPQIFSNEQWLAFLSSKALQMVLE